MNNLCPPIIVASSEISSAFDLLCSQPNALEMLEQMACANDLNDLPLVGSNEWRHFSKSVRQTFADKDHLIVKGLPVSRNGATLLIAARAVGSIFRTYRGGQIIKHFKMSPWTSELSHTTREGEFHTDLNTESCPPALTAMQCLDPDPGAPHYGISRIARLADLLSFLKKTDDIETLQFLTRDTVTMLNDRASSSWSGRAVEEGIIRYHPETLRAAARRFGYPKSTLEERIADIAKAAIAVSTPFILEQGDILLISNHRTLHYRGECSVVFRDYPIKFDSRSVFILHTNQENKRL